jgi:hypothetical protein
MRQKEHMWTSGARMHPWCTRAGIGNPTDKEQLAPSPEGLLNQECGTNVAVAPDGSYSTCKVLLINV